MSVVLQLLQAVALYTSKSPLISLKTTPAELESILEDFDDRLEKFKLLTTCLLAAKQEPTNDGDPLKSIIDQSESDILLSFVHPEITILLGKKKFNNGQSTDDLTQLLKNLIGEVDPEEKIGEKLPKLELKRSNEPKTYITEREIQCGKMKLVQKVVNVRKPTSKNPSK